MEMANHKLLANKTGIDIYFAHSYSSWERGTNENTNRLIRRFFSKGTDVNNITLKQIKEAEYKINNRPRKVVGYQTRNQMMNHENIAKMLSVELHSELTFGSLKSQKSCSEINANRHQKK
jgi:IS30 family transposase